MDCSFLTDMPLDCLTLAQTQADAVSKGISLEQYAAVAIAMAVLILPFIAGNFLSKSLKMPNYGTRFGWILLAVAASAVVLFYSKDPEHHKDFYGPGLGVDLRRRNDFGLRNGSGESW